MCIICTSTNNLVVAQAIALVGQLPPYNAVGDDFNVFNKKKISYWQMLKYVAKFVPTHAKWGVDAAQWASKLQSLPENIVDISIWSNIVNNCSIHATNPFLRKVLQHLQMFSNDIPNGTHHFFPFLVLTNVRR